MPPRIGPKRPVRVYLAAWREHKGLTQQQLGDRISDGVDKATISRWETATRTPSVDVLAAYAEALGISVGSLYRTPDDGPSLDDLAASASKELRAKLAEMIKIMIKTGT